MTGPLILKTINILLILQYYREFFNAQTTRRQEKQAKKAVYRKKAKKNRKSAEKKFLCSAKEFVNKTQRKQGDFAANLYKMQTIEAEMRKNLPGAGHERNVQKFDHNERNV